MPFASVFLQRFLHSKCLSHRCRRFFVCLQFLVFATSGILGICSAFLPSGGEHIVVYGVWWVWTGGGCWGDSSVIELRWKDLIRLGRGGWVRRIVPSLNFVGKTSFAWAEVGWARGIVPSLNFVGKTSLTFALFRVSLPSHFFAIDLHRHI